MKTNTLQPVVTNTPGDTATAVCEAAPGSASANINLKNILVPLDLSDMSLKSLQYAVAFATQFGAKLTLLHVAEPDACTAEWPYPTPPTRESHEAIERRLREIRAESIPEEIDVDIEVRHNFVFDGIVEAARAIRADLIITTTHGYSGLKHVLLGSTAENVVRRAPCPVLVVRELEHDFV